MRSILVMLLFIYSVLSAEEEVKSSPRDSYLDALSDSHNLNTEKKDVKTDREYITDTHGVAYPSNNYGPPEMHYGPPVEPQYGPPSGPGVGPQYGPPSGPPSGPPKYVYGPPSVTVHSYGPPAPIYGPPTAPFYGMPHAMLGFFDKLKLKIDLFTIGKILLKLAIFKKIVALIGILCLLLFIPTLKNKVISNEEDDGIMRKFGFSNKNVDDELNSISAMVLQAIDNFADKSSTTRS